jgi:hypothetical protein
MLLGDTGPYLLRTHTRNILTFWHAKGIDGWVLDAAGYLEEYHHADPEILRTFVGDPCAADDVIVIPEASPPEYAWSRRRGFSHSYDNIGPGGTSSHDVENLATRAIDAEDPRIIESHLVVQTDVARSHGGGTFAFDPRQESLDDARRPLEVALMTAVGVLYEMWFQRDWTHADYGASTERMEEVLRAVNSTPALEPGGTRTVLPVDRASVYAILKTSMDGSRRALCVFNLSSTLQTVTVDLEGSGVAVGQQPVDLVSRGRGPQISSLDYRLEMPGHGFLLLAVDG